MHAITKLVPLILMGGSLLLSACTSVAVDVSGGGVPPAGVIRGTVSYIGPPPCSQNGHVVGNAVLLVFDGRNPPAPAGLGTTAANFGVVDGDVLFKNWPVTQGSTKICPDANAPTQTVSASYAIAPLNPGRYYIQAFFDYTGDFFATLKFRQLPEAMDVGGGYIDLIDAQKLVQNPQATINDAGVAVFPVREQQSDPNYLPHFLPVDVGTPGATPATSLWGVPAFTMPQTGYLADNVTVTIGATLGLSRPYFYPVGVTPAQPPISTFVVYDSSEKIPSAPVKTPANPTGNVNFVPVLSFPQDVQIYAQPTPRGAGFASAVLQQFQAALPEISLQAGMPLAEVPAAAESVLSAYPFHMQLGIPNAPSSYAPGGNGGIFVWWNGTHTVEDCGGDPGCLTDPSNLLDFVPESPGQVYRMWPLVVLAKLQDPPTPGAAQPNPNDIGSLIAQGTDLSKPVVIIQGITLFEDSILNTTNIQLAGSIGYAPLTYPDYAGKTNLKDHVSVLLRPSTLCLDPRAPDNGGVLVTTGTINSAGQILGSFPPADAPDIKGAPPVVIDAKALSNPQLGRLINHKAAGSTNGLMGGCLPTGRYQVNVVYPTGQAWTTPNETGSCADAEGLSVLTSDPGTCKGKPRSVLRSQGTRAVVEITPAQDPNNCKVGATVPPVPFACTSLCPDPSLDPTATPPCSVCLDPNLNPKSSPPCSARLAGR